MASGADIVAREDVGTQKARGRGNFSLPLLASGRTLGCESDYEYDKAELRVSE